MAGLMARTSLIVKSKFSKLLNRAENPNETLDYSYEQMQTQLQNVKRGVADVVTAKKRLELQTQKLEQNVVKLETQARQAVAANREDLAREALERKAAAQQQLQGLDEQVQAAPGPAGEAHRGAADARDAHRELPLDEGSDEGAVLGRRGAGQDRRGRDGDRQAAWRTPARRSSARRTRPRSCRPARRRSTS